MSYVFDSSSLIYLGKLGILEKLKSLEGKKFIPQKVYKEVVTTGIVRGEPEAKYIDGLVKKKLFTVKKPKTTPENIPLLSQADQEVLSLAKETKSTALIDERYASSIAEAQGIKTHGSIYILLNLLKKKIITKEQTINCIDRMIDSGFYLSANKYRDILDVIDKL